MSLVPHGVRADLPYFCAGALPGERPGALGEAGVVSVVQRELGGCGQLGLNSEPEANRRLYDQPSDSRCDKTDLERILWWGLVAASSRG